MTKASKILLPYENQWVALNTKRDKVLASAKDVGELTNKLEKKGIKKDRTTLTWVFPFASSYAPLNG
jgi:hypothetical protein